MVLWFIMPARLLQVFHKLLIYWDLPDNLCRDHREGSKSLDENALLMPVVRGRMVRLLKADITITQPLVTTVFFCNNMLNLKADGLQQQTITLDATHFS